MWVQRILTGGESAWNVLAKKLMNVDEFDLYCKHFTNCVHPNSLFYRQVLDAWYSYHSTQPKIAEEIKAEILWNNKFILIDQKPVLYKKWLKKGIKCVQDLFDENGNLLTSKDLMSRFNMSFNILHHLSLVKAIPKHWRNQMKMNVQSQKVDPEACVYDQIMVLTNKKLYWKLLENTVKQPTAIDHWISLFPFLHDNDFGEIYALPHKLMETRLQSFQYKLLHRILPCKYNLHKWSISQSPSCNYCNCVDTIEHCFFYCNMSDRFWKSVAKWIESLYKVQIPIKITDVLFGIPHRKTQDDMMYILNYVILCGKWYLYTSRKDDLPTSFSRYINLFKYMLSIEEQISINRNKHKEFLKIWSLLLHNL